MALARCTLCSRPINTRTVLSRKSSCMNCFENLKACSNKFVTGWPVFQQNHFCYGTSQPVRRETILLQKLWRVQCIGLWDNVDILIHKFNKNATKIGTFLVNFWNFCSCGGIGQYQCYVSQICKDSLPFTLTLCPRKSRSWPRVCPRENYHIWIIEIQRCHPSPISVNIFVHFDTQIWCRLFLKTSLFSVL